MSGKLYVKQQLPFLILNFLFLTGLLIFLRVIGNSTDTLILILLVWLDVFSVYFLLYYFSRKRQLEKLLKLTEQMEERYLISEVMEKPDRGEDLVFYEILKMAGKSMLEQIENVRRERREYKEYVEQWIHEVKTPITAMKLLCENHRSELTKELLVELEKTNRFTEQALYYARSEHTEKDYSVREIRLFDAVHQAIAENKYLLLQNQVCIDLQETDDTVYSDEKWICFILNQLIVNSVKYRKDKPVLKFYTNRQGNRIFLYVKDNGMGIDKGDLPRIFEKGFTGKNGRKQEQNATGIGLYLCKRLCDKLDIGIDADASEDGTTIRLSFLINEFINFGI